MLAAVAETACGLPISIVIMCVSTCVRAATSPEPEPRGSQVLRLAASRGGPRNALGHRPEPEVRLPSAAPGSIKEGGGPNQVLRLAASREGGAPKRALGYRPEPAPASRNEPRGCHWQHQGGGAPKRARVPSGAWSAAPASRNRAPSRA